MGKILILVDHNEVIKKANEEMNLMRDKLIKEIEAIEEKMRADKRLHWSKIEDELLRLGLIERDSKGKIPSLEIENDELIRLADNDDDENFESYLRKKLKELIKD